MEFQSIEKVEYVLYASNYSIINKLPKILAKFDLLSLDTETRSVYDKETRSEADEYLKEANTYDPYYKQARVVAESSGLSFPSITRTTHFIFGESKTKSHIVICTTDNMEMLMWKLISKYQGTFLVHNSLFDLKIMFQRLKLLPPKFIDTALVVKCMINHVNIWKAKTALKELMGGYYNPRWSLYNDYEPENLKNQNFIDYCAIDGAATIYLWEIIQEELKGIEHD
jgi:hypothetical protein